MMKHFLLIGLVFGLIPCFGYSQGLHAGDDEESVTREGEQFVATTSGEIVNCGWACVDPNPSGPGTGQGRWRYVTGHLCNEQACTGVTVQGSQNPQSRPQTNGSCRINVSPRPPEPTGYTFSSYLSVNTARGTCPRRD